MRYALTVTTPPELEPITLSEAKNHLLVIHDEDDLYISSLVSMARRHVEEITKLRLIETELKISLDDFPRCGDRTFYFPVGPVSSISSITYFDRDNQSQTLATSIYDVDTASKYARVCEADGQSWPDTMDRLNAVSINFVAGFGDEAALVPEDIRGAMLLMIGAAYEYRESFTAGQKLGRFEMFDSLLASHCLEYYA